MAYTLSSLYLSPIQLRCFRMQSVRCDNKQNSPPMRRRAIVPCGRSPVQLPATSVKGCRVEDVVQGHGLTRCWNTVVSLSQQYQIDPSHLIQYNAAAYGNRNGLHLKCGLHIMSAAHQLTLAELVSPHPPFLKTQVVPKMNPSHLTLG